MRIRIIFLTVLMMIISTLGISTYAQETNDEDLILSLSEKTCQVNEEVMLHVQDQQEERKSLQFILPENITAELKQTESATLEQTEKTWTLTWKENQIKQTEIRLKANRAGSYVIQIMDTEQTLALDVSETSEKEVQSKGQQEKDEFSGINTNEESSLIQQGEQSHVVKNAETDDGWIEQTTVPMSEMTVNNEKIQYYFGYREDIGKPVNDMKERSIPAFGVPQYDLIQTNGTIYHAAREYLSSSDVQTCESLFDVTYNNMDTITNLKLYLKPLENGKEMQKVSFDSVNPAFINYSPGEEKPTLHYEVVIKPNEDGTLSLTYNMENISAVSANEAILGLELAPEASSHALGEVYYAGNYRGLYVEEKNLNVRLAYDFKNPNTTNPFPNWKAGIVYYPGTGAATILQPSEAFNGRSGTGFENDSAAGGTVAFKNFDIDTLIHAGVYAKTMPVTLEQGQKISATYNLSFYTIQEKPELVLDQATTGNETIPYYGDDFEISGVVKDQNQGDLEVYYQIDNEEIKKAAYVENTAYAYLHSGYDYHYTIPKEELRGKTNPKITVYTKNQQTGELSESSIANLAYNDCMVTVHYVDEAGDPIKEAKVFYGMKGSSYMTTPPNIYGYAYVLTEGNASGTFSQTPQTVTFHYKGQLLLTSAPMNVLPDDDVLQLSGKPQTYGLRPDQALTVQDFRPEGSKWSITARLSKELTSFSTRHVLKDSLFFYRDGQEVATLNATDSVLIYEKTTSVKKEITDVSKEWGSTDDGLILHVQPGTARSEKYHGTIQFALQMVPSNTEEEES
ncbi:MucBP domain-containing protein [Listeria ilorinensis]|uniref:MucBP domain-containing protein n=1 Tax=Listeria ilorinensis TaxID=2867439 RepID=UPI001EF5D53F|nr:MucBP domain-containing protein [Listeria ilorinensis]